MRNRIISLMSVLVLVISLCACSASAVESDTEESTATEPDRSEIIAICKLATLECYYHNVAKSTKAAGSGITHWGEKDRTFWVEYSGVAKLGVDMSKGDVEIDGDTITIYIPEAEIISIQAAQSSMSDTIANNDAFFNKNQIELDDVTAAVKVAEEDIQNQIINDTSLLTSAQDRAKKLIENYINQLGEMTGSTYTVKWEDAYTTKETDSILDTEM
jgi:uncharacterized lipoprotein YehR (DUF1307 family)